MNRTVCTLLMVSSLFACLQVQGQQGKSKAGSESSKAKPRKIFMPQAFIGKSSEYKGGPIKKDELTNLLKQGITSRDSAGNNYEVTGFEFGYAERALYEDSLSNLVVMVDYMTEYCTGDTLSGGVASSIYDRFKAGDTLYFNRVDVLKKRPGEAGGDVISAKGMKFYIVK